MSCRLIAAIGLVTALNTSMAQQPKPAARICPATLSVHPVDIRHSDLPILQQARFEIRTCDPGESQHVQLLGFSMHAKSPALIVDTDSPWIVFLLQTGPILVMQVMAGDSSPTYIAQFKRGVPVLLFQDSAAGGPTYSEDHTNRGGFAIISIPRKVFPDDDGKFPKVPPYRFRLKVYPD